MVVLFYGLLPSHSEHTVNGMNDSAQNPSCTESWGLVSGDGTIAFQFTIVVKTLQ